jgi:replicative DNA helicase
VMFIYREAYYKSKERVEAEDGEAQQQQPGVENIEEAELIIAKQRNGPTGRVHVGFMPHYARFENLDRTHHARDDE